ncbi:MAG: saccharopine dehydrogenase family protein [Pseudomonadales bacterium]
MAVKRVVVLGGYGNFGKRIVERLARHEIVLFVAGRTLSKARELCDVLIQEGALADVQPAVLDITRSDLEAQLQALAPQLVIHTSGPFQGQNYAVVQACLAIGSHYIDLADDRRYVCDIAQFNDRACANNLLLVSGASSVPGLSSCVLEHFAERFSVLDEIDIAIAPGNRAERGEATVRGILSYTGHSFKTYREGQWADSYGWMNPRRRYFGKRIGWRWLANVDIPDLELLPARYPALSTVRFQAGLELPLLHWGMVGMAWIARLGIVKDWSRYTKPIVASSNWLLSCGTDMGGMRVTLRGLSRGLQKHSQTLHWTLVAPKGVGPYIPTLSTIILAEQLIAGHCQHRGATPCVALYDVDSFNQVSADLGLEQCVEVCVG